MENTGSMLFKDNSAKWYIAQGSTWVGPLKASEISAKLEKGELTPAHYILEKGQKQWKRILEVKDFEPSMPPPPPPEFVEEVREEEVKKASKNEPAVEKPWYVHSGDSQLGPFSTEEVQRAMSVGTISSSSHAWKDGMLDWEPLSGIAEFKGVKRAPPPMPKKKEDKRSSFRKPLVARIIMANKDKIVLGICRDISLGGMQVLTEQVPGPVGTEIKMNISPPQGLKAFVAEGEIVRVLEDGRGFSFRFKKLAPDSKKAIEKYISTS